MIWLLIPFVLLLIPYAFLIGWYRRSWGSIRVPVLHAPVATPVGTSVSTPNNLAVHHPMTVSVIIPCRNEAANIGNLLQAIARQDYPASLLQVIVVDDLSEDGTPDIVRRFPRVRLIELRKQPGFDPGAIQSFKKKAVDTGIRAATGQFILCTDADCLPRERWISSMVAFRQTTGARLVAGPVLLSSRGSLLEDFQVIDFEVLQGITGAAVERRVHSMGNGANLGYDRDVFLQVNGFEGIDAIASGDDILLMHKIDQAFPGSCRYLKHPDAIVTTAALASFAAFLSQRIRWASKATHYKDRKLFPILLMVWLLNAWFPAALLAGFFQPWLWAGFVTACLLKALLEWRFFRDTDRFFGGNSNFLQFASFQPLHIAYTVGSGVLGQMRTYEWKGRRVR